MRYQLAESGSSGSGGKVRLVGKSLFDDMELSSDIFPSKEDAEKFISQNPSDNFVAYELQGDGADPQ